LADPSFCKAEILPDFLIGDRCKCLKCQGVPQRSQVLLPQDNPLHAKAAAAPASR
jgi:hypothetical protein